MVQGRLSKRLLLQILLVSGVLTALFTGFQVYLDYSKRLENFKHRLHQAIIQTEPTLAMAMYQNDVTFVGTALVPLRSFSDITAIIITYKEPHISPVIRESKDGILDQRDAEPNNTDFYTVKKELIAHNSFYSNGEQHVLLHAKVGDLELVVGIQHLKAEVIENLVNIILLQFIKTFFASFIILMLINNLVIKRQKKIEKWLGNYSPVKPFEELQIGNGRKSDELDSLAETVNKMGRELNSYSTNLHSLVSDKTRELRQKNQLLEDTQQQLHKLVQRKENALAHINKGLGTCLWECDPFGNLISFSDNCLSALSFEQSDRKQARLDLIEFAEQNIKHAFIKTIKSSLETREPFKIQNIALKPVDDTKRYVAIEGKPCYVSGEYVGFTGSIVDTTESINLSKLAYTDGLTGLPNRVAFDLATQKLLKRAERHQFTVGVLAIDIDHFKSINDTFGHDIGDIVLKEVSKCMLSCLREDDVIARVGGEEFTIAMSDTTFEGITALAKRINEAVHSLTILALEDARKVTVSIGCCLLRDEEAISHALKRADILLYESKKTGRNRFTSDAVN